MVGILYVRLLEYQNNFYGEQNMTNPNDCPFMVMPIKKIAKWSMLVPVKIVEWIIWPVAKVHAWLCKFADWLTMKM
jgi:hypothetical protein